MDKGKLYEPSMFDHILERNLIFALDSSGSMYNCLEAIKENIIQFLLHRAHSLEYNTFNILEFSSEITQWSEKMVQCTPQTVSLVSDWIKNIEAKTGTNTLDALLSAFNDPVCEAVVLVTDGLPDQQTSEILDHVSYACGSRPVHAYYIQQGTADSPAITFLSSLAQETYGSFHIITVTDHGLVQKVTPIYMAASCGPILRAAEGATYSGDIYPKYCSVNTKLHGLPLLPHSVAMQFPHAYAWPYNRGVPFWRDYYYWWAPGWHAGWPIGWSKYRTSRGWIRQNERLLKHVDELMGVGPGPGVMLVGQSVLARRHEDGLFYYGTVKSQVMEEKFLVELGPCKHGRFKDVVYQETHVFDIIAYDDALRHSIHTEDKVLAPWEPDGERYGPGLVLAGQEKRTIQSTTEDEKLTIKFFNGKTELIPFRKAVWVPAALHERIQFEISLPYKVRKEFMEQKEYPDVNLPGYPVSGPVMHPEKWEKITAAEVERETASGVIRERGLAAFPRYVPLYPLHYKHCVNADTCDELSKRVQEQIKDHESRNENKSLQKSVSFSNVADEAATVNTNNSTESHPKVYETTSKEETKENTEPVTEYYDPLSDCDLDEDELLYNETKLNSVNKSDAAVGTDHRLLRRRSRGRPRPQSAPKQRWQYWGSGDIPTLLEPMHFGRHRVGPYEEAVPPVPLEARDPAKRNKEDMWELEEPRNFDHVSGVMIHPHPPRNESAKNQGSGVELSSSIGVHLKQQEQQARLRMDLRRRRYAQRSADWNEKLQEDKLLRQWYIDGHKQRTLNQLAREEERKMQDIRQEEKRLLSRREISAGIRADVKGRSMLGKDDEQKKLAYMRMRRSMREEENAERRNEISELMARRQLIKQQQAQLRWEAVSRQLDEEDRKMALESATARTAQAARRAHFRRVEMANQRNKERLDQNNAQAQAVWRSQVLP